MTLKVTFFRLAWLTLFFLGIALHAQKPKATPLEKKIADNSKLFQTNINAAYRELQPLINESRHVKDSLAELKLLERKCRYFYNKNLIDSLIKSSGQLQRKA